MKRRHQRWHLRLWIALSLLLPALLLLTLGQRQERPLEPAVDYLSAPAKGAG
jgi:hypothetical protein